ncbi:YifB family Mg chelatase-like AAA ATPase N-terminal domain protein [Candidatus Hepatincolaceae symbiont of Richtersius coronifer]
MLSRTNSVAFEGISAKFVDVQVNIAKGLPAFNIVGLADKAVSESKERVRAAFYALGMPLPASRIVVNLSPADLSKEGSHFDLAIALAILGAMEVVPRDEIINYLAIGELALDGEIKAVNRVLAASLFACEHNKGIIFPKSQLNEMFLVNNQIEILPVNNLLEIIQHLKGDNFIKAEVGEFVEDSLSNQKFVEMQSIKGQESAKRALEITAAGKLINDRATRKWNIYVSKCFRRDITPFNSPRKLRSEFDLFSSRGA